MKKQISNLPNLLVLVAVLTLAFLASGCGVTSTNTTTPINTNLGNTTTIPTTQNTVSKNSGQVIPTIISNNTGNNSGMMGNSGNNMMNQYSYKNGTYSANGEYFVEGKESIGVSLTLKNDIVTDASVQVMSRGGTSRSYQMMFVDNFKSQVVGKDISSLNLNRVAGASLTTQGFNNAVSIIKSQASL